MGCILVIDCLLCSRNTETQTLLQWSEKMANTAMPLWKDPHLSGEASFSKWSHGEGVILKGMEGLWRLTGNGDYFRYLQHSMDYFVDDAGNCQKNIKIIRLPAI